MHFALRVLGTSSALFAHGRHQSSVLIELEHDYYMVDCGEGTQLQMQNLGLKASRIKCIFISHLHGDHYLGLMGLLSTMGLQGRTQSIEIYGPEGLETITRLQLQHGGGRFNYAINFHTVTGNGEVIFQDHYLKVSTLPLEHSVPVIGFMFEEIIHKLRLIKGAVVNVPYRLIMALQDGEDPFWEEEGITLDHKDFTYPPRAPRRIAYCCDTCYKEELIPLVSGVDILYHEATFTDNLLERAIATKHSTATQAASIAKAAGVKKLIITHFSSRFVDPSPLLVEASTVFTNTSLAVEGARYLLTTDGITEQEQENMPILTEE